MLRDILGAILGYLAIVVVIIASLFLVWQILGGSGAFSGDGPEPSMAWNLAALASGLVAAFVGGKTAAKIGRGPRAAHILLTLVLALGLFGALTAESAWERRQQQAPEGKAAGDLTFLEAGTVARSPTWYNWTIPLVGAIGVFLGGRHGAAKE